VTAKPFARRVRVLDATLREGDQAAGFAFSREEKISLAEAIAGLGVDVIEAGFPLSSPADFESCAAISRLMASPGSPLVSVMCRAIPEEIASSARAFADPSRGILHLTLPVSDRHARVKLGLDRAGVLALVREAVSCAADLAGEVELGAEDATRADPSFLAEYCAVAVDSGARVVNIADTVGRSLPAETARLVSVARRSHPAFQDGRAIISVHCHDDLGLALANTLAALSAGAGQAEVTLLGLGERAGNLATETFAAVLDERRETLRVDTGIDLGFVGRAVGLLSSIVGSGLSPLKPVTGTNARAHASGIHQHGLAWDPYTYRSVYRDYADCPPERFVVSRHSGLAGVVLSLSRMLGRDPVPGTAEMVLARAKAGEGTLGPSEILETISGRERLRTIRAESFALSYEEGLGARAVARFAGDRAETVTTGSDPRQAIEALVLARTGFPVSARVMSLWGYGIGLGSCRTRLYVEAEIKGTQDSELAVERVGLDPGRLLLEALLDCVNVAMARARAS
jgi:2-isopropylmalate synthase